MKHSIPVTFVLIGLFLVAQLFGLFLIGYDASIDSVEENGVVTTTVTHEDTAIGERPDFQGASSFLYLLGGIAFATIMLLIIIRLRKGRRVWKAWYFLAVTMTITVSLGVFTASIIAFVFAIILAIWKIRKPNTFIHNFTEVLVYSGLGLLFVPLFDIFWASMLFLAIMVYDAYAVWRSKHMIQLAQFTTESNLFAGLMITYEQPSKQKKSTSKAAKTSRSRKKGTPSKAILGGGDIVFPLLFIGAIFEHLLTQGYSFGVSYALSSVVIAFATLSLGLLFFYGKKDRFYPAMPFLGLGCFVGLGLIQLLLLLI